MWSGLRSLQGRVVGKAGDRVGWIDIAIIRQRWNGDRGGLKRINRRIRWWRGCVQWSEDFREEGRGMCTSQCMYNIYYLCLKLCMILFEILNCYIRLICEQSIGLNIPTIQVAVPQLKWYLSKDLKQSTIHFWRRQRPRSASENEVSRDSYGDQTKRDEI